MANPKFSNFDAFMMAAEDGEVDRKSTKLWISSSSCGIWEWNSTDEELPEGEERQGALLVELGRPEDALAQLAEWLDIIAEET